MTNFEKHITNEHPLLSLLNVEKVNNSSFSWISVSGNTLEESQNVTQPFSRTFTQSFIDTSSKKDDEAIQQLLTEVETTLLLDKMAPKDVPNIRHTSNLYSYQSGFEFHDGISDIVKPMVNKGAKTLALLSTPSVLEELVGNKPLQFSEGNIYLVLPFAAIKLIPCLNVPERISYLIDPEKIKIKLLQDVQVSESPSDGDYLTKMVTLEVGIQVDSPEAAISIEVL